MGNKCGCGAKEEPMTQEQLDGIVKIQSGIRTSLAVKERNKMKNEKLEELFTQDKKNHKGAETWMLTQRIGTLKLSEIIMDDKEPRIFYDKMVEIEEGRSYKGQWHKKTNFKDGVGIMFWPDGTKYEGQFRNDKQHGKGRKIFSNGEFYIGNFANDKANGFGVFQDLNGGKYEGEWKDDKQHGHGKEIWNNGAETYEGDFVEGKKNGRGRFSWSDGSYYEGDFVDGLFEGVGVYYFKESEKTYNGQFHDGKIEGEGEMKWGDGREYYGQFRDGKEDGEGTFKYANGNLYIGKFKEGKQNSFAIFINIEESTKRHGEWKDGKRLQWLSSAEAINTDSSPIKASSYMSKAVGLH